MPLRPTHARRCPARAQQPTAVARVIETELKFQVPAASRQVVLKALATTTAVTTRLQAVYADTPARDLATAGLALRLRKEGRVWKQTLKGRGDGLMQRLEHEVPLPVQPGEPALDVQRHAGTPVGDKLLALLQRLGDGAVLAPIYRTDIRRLHRRVRHGGALIELAYDRGHIIAGEHRVRVDELEFELVRGPSAALVGVAAQWSRRFGLWWDVRTKSERGYRLALGMEQMPAVKALPAALPAGSGPEAALAHMLATALSQALPNAAEIASGTATPEHLHQLRVALRRLRTALRVFADWAPDPGVALLLEADWRAPFGLLGAARDTDVIAQTLLPALAAAGAPALPPPAATHAVSPDDVVRGVVFTSLLLRTLALCAAPESGPTAQADKASKPDARAAVQPLWRQVRRAAPTFVQASVEDQHRLRKRIKRLRYALEAVQPLLKRQSIEAFLRALRRALGALGELNDLQVADVLYRQRAGAEPQAWFAVGYLAARRQAALDKSVAALARLTALKLAWR